MFEENIGTDLSLDETCLSNGEVYTVLTNKTAHGRKGALVAMVHGVASDTVIRAFKRMTRHQRLQLETITTDLSSAMMLTARRAFPRSQLINDRFHVQQLMNEAVDQLRVRYRREVLDAENKAIREYRQKRKEAKLRGDSLAPWKPTKMSNGETMPQIMLWLAVNISYSNIPQNGRSNNESGLKSYSKPTPDSNRGMNYP